MSEFGFPRSRRSRTADAPHELRASKLRDTRHLHLVPDLPDPSDPADLPEGRPRRWSARCTRTTRRVLVTAAVALTTSTVTIDAAYALAHTTHLH
ncbi:hypothetical protein [Kineosporia succinea]|uniref:Uncharacterized protein n=1 Tax=Kineosporia succinea TaxID=84632 RepID=A0ABT9PC20_9ACTN|nr:hypothetical protein [Kineosporia succinea]MDP9829550.1 hypothetical protein [Kineosporia succinea]